MSKLPLARVPVTGVKLETEPVPCAPDGLRKKPSTCATPVPASDTVARTVTLAAPLPTFTVEGVMVTPLSVGAVTSSLGDSTVTLDGNPPAASCVDSYTRTFPTWSRTVTSSLHMPASAEAGMVKRTSKVPLAGVPLTRV
jgi:hypothetical protein